MNVLQPLMATAGWGGGGGVNFAHFLLYFFDASSSFLQVTRTIIKAWTSLNFDKIPSPTSELAALERLKNQ